MADVPSTQPVEVPEVSTVNETSAPEATETTDATEAGADASAAKPMLVTTGKHNRKAAESDAPVTDDPVQIRKKAEYYFNDANFPEDKFLWEKMGGEENKPIPVKLLTSFTRMRRFQPYSAVVAALKDSDVVVVEGPEGEEKIKRKTPYVSTTRQEIDAATVYIKGFGDERDGTQAELEDFFAPYDGVLAVRLRRERDRSLAFKGSVWVVFKTKALAEQFMALDPKPTYQGHELMIMSKPDYCNMKLEMIQKGEMEPNKNEGSGPSRFWQGRESSKSRGNSNGRGGNRGRGGGRGRPHHNNGRGGGPRARNNAPRDAAHDPRANGNDAAAAAKPEEASNKRSRDGDDGDEPASKKVDSKTTEVTVA